MSPRYGFSCGDLGAVEVEVEAESVAEAIRVAEEMTGHFVIGGRMLS